jgi:hypothetical protein
MADRRHLLEAGVDATVNAVRTYGALAFAGLTEPQVARLATDAINHLSRRNVDLATILSSTLASDDSWESITYSVISSGMRCGVLVRTIKYKTLAGLTDRPDDVRHGPLIPMDKAQALLALLNSPPDC